ncbi:HAD domain-containing protein [Paraburkholderia sp.]|uniref:HAD domain-containing protein n=1 Tax=Paraburkholderia sp. TaxID=1926495 RepID=UPI003C72002A
MARNCIFYLAVEGVLVPRGAVFHKLLPGDVHRFRESPHASQLSALVVDQEHVGVVVNSAWVSSLGFRCVLDFLPYPLRHRVIGATVPGNRMLRCRWQTNTFGRCGWLAADVERREPAQLTVLESDARQVPVPLRDRAVIVPGGLWAAQIGDWIRLRDMLARRA